jgi:hypothetical protein
MCTYTIIPLRTLCSGTIGCKMIIPSPIARNKVLYTLLCQPNFTIIIVNCGSLDVVRQEVVGFSALAGVETCGLVTGAHSLSHLMVSKTFIAQCLWNHSNLFEDYGICSLESSLLTVRIAKGTNLEQIYIVHRLRSKLERERTLIGWIRSHDI